jgi:hypothetical protein
VKPANREPDEYLTYFDLSVTGEDSAHQTANWLAQQGFEDPKGSTGFLEGEKQVWLLHGRKTIRKDELPHYEELLTGWVKQLPASAEASYDGYEMDEHPVGHPLSDQLAASEKG